jgi:hypothetical protein
MPGVFSNTDLGTSNSGRVGFLYARKNATPMEAAQLVWIELARDRNQ